MDGDTTALRETARQVRALARRLEAEAARTAGLVEVAWVSDEADRWRAGIEAAAAAIRRDARSVESYARSLIDHATAVERNRAALDGPGRW